LDYLHGPSWQNEKTNNIMIVGKNLDLDRSDKKIDFYLPNYLFVYMRTRYLSFMTIPKK